MARDHEVEVDSVVQTSEDPPHQILQHGVVFVLPSTVVCVQAHSRFPKAIVLKNVVEKTTYNVGSFFVLQASSMMKFTCSGIASQQMPKMAAFRGVRK